MDQVREGKITYDGFPEDATGVQVFTNMPNSLMSCGKIVRKKRPQNNTQ